MKYLRHFYLFLLFSLINVNLKAQEFKTIISYPNVNVDISTLIVLPDSSFVSFQIIDYPGFHSRIFDSTITLLARHNPNGEIIYQRRLPIARDFQHLYVTCMSSYKNHLYIGASIGDSFDTWSQAVLIKLDLCLDIEKFIQFQTQPMSYAGIKGIYQFNDSELIVKGAYLIPSDTTFNSLIQMDTGFNIKWITSYIGTNDDLILHNNEIHVWGSGEFPRLSNQNIFEKKLYYYKFNFQGKPIYRYVENEHVDFKYGGGTFY